MKAIVCTQYGPPENLKIEEIEKPVPMEGEVLVRVRAGSINSADWRMLVADPFIMRFMGPGFLRPKQRPGSDMTGTVDSVGPGVKRLKPGDDVVGDLFNVGRGAFAEYACVPEDVLCRKPAGLSFEEAAAVPLAGVTALNAVMSFGKSAPGMKVLINGASGGVGTFALQLAKLSGADVTAVCSAANREQARSLGADRVIDYRAEDFTKEGERYDLILGVNGNLPLSAYRDALRPGGAYLMVGGGNRQLFQAFLLARRYSRGDKKFGSVSSHPDSELLDAVLQLVAAGTVKVIIDKAYPMDQVAEAYRRFGTGHAHGKIVITM
jgi:NADPH:quinone reductase-like Zn-dependent oxidoreductase